LFFRILGCLFGLVIAAFLLVRVIGKKCNGRIPDGGINEALYVEINGTKQWISIYGQDRNNPVLLYLHGGPGASTSAYDYAFTRKWSDVYTVVTWDQRNCGKSYAADQKDVQLTCDLMMSDGLEMTKFILDRLGKEKITVLGHSWGTFLGCNLVLAHPELYDCYIGAGQLVDFRRNEEAFKEAAVQWVGDDKKGKRLVDRLTVGDFSGDYYAARNALMKQYGYDIFADGTDYSMAAAQMFNPYYTFKDFLRVLRVDHSAYRRFLNSAGFTQLSLVGKTEYQIPFYNVNGDKDYQTNYRIAQLYFDSLTAPRKGMYIMENTTHGLLESKSEAFSDIVHQIARQERAVRR